MVPIRRPLRVVMCICLTYFAVPRLLPSQTFTTLYNFGKTSSDGSRATGRLLVSNNGVLYGTTYYGGAYGKGTVFTLTPPASAGGVWTEEVIWSFGASGDGIGPEGGVVIGNGGCSTCPNVVLGLTESGGGYGTGMCYSLIAPTSRGGTWTESPIWPYGFGHNPRTTWAEAADGTLFASTYSGGSYNGGTIVSLYQPAGAWAGAYIWSFGSGADGRYPEGRLAMDANGIVYGTTRQGGAGGGGIVFSLIPPVVYGGTGTESVIWNFQNRDGDLRSPDSGVVVGAGGVLYGTTPTGGGGNLGVVFSLTPPPATGDPWTMATIASFGRHSIAGWDPEGGLLLSTQTGKLYGTTAFGPAVTGSNGYGTVFELTPPASPGGVWGLRSLHQFVGSDGARSYAGLTQANDVLYGVTTDGGAYGQGTVFSIAP